MKLKLLTITLALLVLAGCVKDSFNLQKLKGGTYNPTVAAPLVFTSLSLSEILRQNESDLINIDDDGFISLIYKSSLLSSTAEELITLSDQSYSQFISPGISLPSLPIGTTQTYSETQTMTFAAAPNQLDSMVIKSGTLDFSFSSSFDADVNIIVTIPGATSGGVPFSETISILSNSSTNSSISLSGYTFDLTKGGTTVNEFDVNYDLTLTGNGSAINGTDQLSVGLDITSLLFQKLFGVLDLSNISPEEDTVGITLFNGASGIGNFTLVDPQVKLYTKNSFGASLEANFLRMDGTNTISGTTYDLITSGALPTPWTINGPTMSQIGQTVEDSLIINGTEIINMISDQPKYFIYNLNAGLQGGGGQIFVLDTSKIEFDAEVNIPLHGTVKNFTLIDTLGLDLGMDAVVNLTLTSRIRNGFPIEFDITFYALEWDGANLILTDSAYTGTSTLLAESGILTNGRVTQVSETETDIVLNDSQTRNFSNANQMIIKAVASTANNGATNVKFYSDYNLEVKVGAIAEIETEF